MDQQNWSEQLLAAMNDSDRTAAAAVIEQALTNGFDSDRVITEILDPAIVKLGQLWYKETMSLTQSFVAAKIAEDVLLRCLPDQGSNHKSRGAIVIGNIEDDFHSLGRRMVTLFLLAAGWEVHDLGNDVLAEELLDKAIEVNACVVGASAMMQTTALNIRKLRDLIDSRGLTDKIKLAVGGAVFNWRPELVAEVGGDGTTRNATGADELFTRLQAEVISRRSS